MGVRFTTHCKHSNNPNVRQMSALRLAEKRKVFYKVSEIHGAGYKIRTRDPLITNQVLYQLS
jgi:hypothetical protein